MLKTLSFLFIALSLLGVLAACSNSSSKEAAAAGDQNWKKTSTPPATQPGATKGPH